MKKIYYLWILILLAGSCRQDDLAEEGGRYPVSFNLPVIEMVTRATDGVTDLAVNTTLTVAAYHETTGSLAAQCNYKVSSSGTMEPDPSGTKMYLSAGTYKFCTISPAQTLAEGGRSATIATGVDVLGSVTRALMLSKATTIDLDNLSHLASQIWFTFRMVQKNTDLTQFKVNKVKIGNLVTSFEANLQLPDNRLVVPGTGEAGKFETTDTEIANTSSSPTFDYNVTVNGKNGSHYNVQKEPILVFPRAADPFKITVLMDEKTATATEATTKQYSATISQVAFEPGKQYHFTVNFGWDFMNFTVTVSDWDKKDNGQGSVGSGEQEINTSFTVDVWGEEVSLGGNLGGS